MANYKRRRPRTTSAHSGYSRRSASTYWMSQWPRWHDIVFHTRPQRRRTREAVVLVMQGRDPDTILWPVEKKPHIFYW